MAGVSDDDRPVRCPEILGEGVVLLSARAPGSLRAPAPPPEPAEEHPPLRLTIEIPGAIASILLVRALADLGARILAWGEDLPEPPRPIPPGRRPPGRAA